MNDDTWIVVSFIHGGCTKQNCKEESLLSIHSSTGGWNATTVFSISVVLVARQ